MSKNFQNRVKKLEGRRRPVFIAYATQLADGTYRGSDGVIYPDADALHAAAGRAVKIYSGGVSPDDWE